VIEIKENIDIIDDLDLFGKLSSKLATLANKNQFWKVYDYNQKNRHLVVLQHAPIPISDKISIRIYFTVNRTQQGFILVQIEAYFYDSETDTSMYMSEIDVESRVPIEIFVDGLYSDLKKVERRLQIGKQIEWSRNNLRADFYRFYRYRSVDNFPIKEPIILINQLRRFLQKAILKSSSRTSTGRKRL